VSSVAAVTTVPAVTTVSVATISSSAAGVRGRWTDVTAGARQGTVGVVPDAARARAGAYKDGGGQERDESHTERVFRQILTLFIAEETEYRTH